MIEEFKFGFFRINRKEYYDDIKIVDKRVKQWGDRERHTLKLSNLKDILESNPELLVVGIGATGLLEVPKDVHQALQMKKIKLVVEKTQKACEVFNNALTEKKKVAAILHGTC